jgi:hypothetical protein
MEVAKGLGRHTLQYRQMGFSRSPGIVHISCVVDKACGDVQASDLYMRNSGVARSRGIEGSLHLTFLSRHTPQAIRSRPC